MQEGWKRFAAVAVAVGAILVAFALLQPGDDELADRGREAPATEQESSGGEAAGGSRPLLGGTRNEPGAEPEPEPVALELADGEVVGGVATIEATRGEALALRVTSDAQEELHVHGVNLHQDLPAGQEVEVRFTPRVEGVFEVELHESGTLIAKVEVEPS